MSYPENIESGFLKIMILDNYDSFTYNLVQYIEELCGYTVDVHRNDEISVEDVNNYDVLFLSPGPGLPKDSGILLDVIKTYTGKKPIFGVCLGLQAICENFGGKLANLTHVFHGLATEVSIASSKETLFQGLPNPFIAGRYHSWVVTKESLPDVLKITAIDTEGGEIMAVAHKDYLLKAVQFHPESILTPQGKKIIANFLIEAEVISA